MKRIIILLLILLIPLASAGTATLAEVGIYGLGFTTLLLLMLGIVFIISRLPSGDSTDESGTILQISNLKHLRNVLWIMVWGLSLAIVFLVSNLSIEYLPDVMMGNFLFILWRIMFWFTVIGLPVYFVWIFYRIFKDKEFKRMIERGIEVRTP